MWTRSEARRAGGPAPPDAPLPGLAPRRALDLVRRGWVWILVATLVGAGVGFAMAAARTGYEATVVMGVSGGGDPIAASTLAESAASTIGSEAVISESAVQLGVDPLTLLARTSSSVEKGTTLIDVTGIGESPSAAIAVATTVAQTALAGYRSRSALAAEQVRAAGQELLATGKLAQPTAETARQESIGTVVGAAQGASIEGEATLFVVSSAQRATPIGVSRTVGVLLGAAAGLLVALLVLLSRSGRRSGRVRSTSDLEFVPGVTATMRASEVERLAGAALESGCRIVVLMGVGVPPRELDLLADGMGAWLRLGGRSVGTVEVADDLEAPVGLTLRSDGGWAVSSGQAGTVLARSARDRVTDSLHANVLIVCIDADDPSTRLMFGQRDFMPVFAVAPGTRRSTIDSLVEPFGDAGVVAVLVGS